MKLDMLLRPDAVAKRKATEAFMKQNLDALIPYFNKEEMPWFMIDGLKKLGINGLNIKGYGSPEFN
jgi:hypothetical protein